MTKSKMPSKSIYLTCSKEIDEATKKPFKEVWIHFRNLEGVNCGLNMSYLLSTVTLSPTFKKCIDEAIENY